MRKLRWLSLLIAIVFPMGITVVSPLLHADSFYSPHPERQFTTISSDGAQFTDDQFNKLATNKGIVILSKGMPITARYEAARELVKRNPSIKVLVYMPTKIWYDSNANKWKEPGYDPVASFCDCWLLRDMNGNTIPQRSDGEEKDSAFMIDLSNADYRTWALGVLKHWLNAAPFSGIHFDNGNDFVDGYDGRNWSKVLGQTKLDSVNAGMKTLHTQAKDLAGTGKIVTFNGIGPNETKGEDRSVNKLGYLDGATEEGYCSGGNNLHLNEDRDIMVKYPHDLILLHNHYKLADNPDAPRVLRFCLANFLMGWQPGSTYINSVRVGSYGTSGLDYHLPELDLNHGNPTGSFKQTGDVLSRTFTNGIVYVNNGSAAQNIQFSQAVVRMEDGVKESYAAGASYSLAAQTGVFFINQAAVGNLTSSGQPIVPKLSSIKDLPSVIVHETVSPTDADNIYNQTSNKWLFWLTQLVYLEIIATAIGVIVLVLNYFGLLNPVKYVIGKARTRLLPPRWK